MAPALCHRIRLYPFLLPLVVKGRGVMIADLDITISDVVYLINYLFKFKQVPDPLKSVDVNYCDEIDIIDAIFLVNYLFKDGSTPC
jgi:hypothetical protein